MMPYGPLSALLCGGVLMSSREHDGCSAPNLCTTDGFLFVKITVGGYMNAHFDLIQ